VLSLLTAAGARWTRPGLSVIRVTAPEKDTAMPKARPAIGTATHRTPSSCSSMTNPADRICSSSAWSRTRLAMVCAWYSRAGRACQVGRRHAPNRAAIGVPCRPRAVEVDPLLDLGEHPYVVPRRSLGDVLGLIARKNGMICRLTGFVDEIEKDALGDRADESASRLCEWQDTESQRVPSKR
jgi:hypothetical protein